MAIIHLKLVSFRIGTDHHGFGGGLRCDAPIQDGTPDGVTSCSAPDGGGAVFEIPFKQGVVDGDFVVLNPKKAGQTIASARFSAGRLNGPSEIFSPATGKRMHQLSWEQGVPVGSIERYDEHTGKLRFKADFVAGRMEGEVFSYDSEGRLLQRQQVKNGLAEGLVKQFDPETGKVIKQTQWHEGYPQAPEAASTTNSTTPANDAKLEHCTDAKVAAFHKEKGDEEPVTADMLEEWKSQCLASLIAS
ncbi:hypothetical protein JHS3_15280 [Jeongeupia sp. HS-3]|nr:hypothetical protein JHS3_15280 [Jeongeupia sp. HS-3]